MNHELEASSGAGGTVRQWPGSGPRVGLVLTWKSARLEPVVAPLGRYS